MLLRARHGVNRRASIPPGIRVRLSILSLVQTRAVLADDQTSLRRQLREHGLDWMRLSGDELVLEMQVGGGQDGFTETLRCP